MSKRALLSTLLFLAAALLCIDGFRSLQITPGDGEGTAEGTVLSHEVRLDEERWKGRIKHPLVLESRIRLNPQGIEGEATEMLVHGYFDDANSACELAHRHPVGEMARFHLTPGAKAGTWKNPEMLRFVGELVAALAVAALALCVAMGITKEFLLPFGMLYGAALIFTFLGVFCAWKAWGSAATYASSATWTSVPCELLGERQVVNTGRGTRKYETAYRYTWNRRDFVALASSDSFRRSASTATGGQKHLCQVNPLKPWQSEVGSAWGMVMIAVLFPVPFLAAGIALMVFAISESLPNRPGATGRSGSATGRWREAWRRGFVCLFTVPIVVIMSAICVDMWMLGKPTKWLLTLFLVPFVAWVSVLICSFFRELVRAIRG